MKYILCLIQMRLNENQPSPAKGMVPLSDPPKADMSTPRRILSAHTWRTRRLQINTVIPAKAGIYQ